MKNPLRSPFLRPTKPSIKKGAGMLSAPRYISSVITGFIAIALYAPPASGQNTLYGSGALVSNTTGINNTAIGVAALFSNTSGGNNTANGHHALLLNTTGQNNTANGSSALFQNTTGGNNTANGMEVLYSNTTGANNTANGYQALYSNTTGVNNTVNGYQTLYLNTTGGNNTTNGYQALYSNTTGGYNTANGTRTLYSNTTGGYNTANGINALFYNTTGSWSTALGSHALHFNTTGVSNTALGTGALFSNTTGTNNCGFGVFALSTNITGNYNTAFGNNADVTTGNLNNATAVGYNAVVDASDKVRIGNTAVTSIGGQVGWTTFSDGRYKKEVKEAVAGLAFINSLRPVTYTVNIAGLNEHFNKDRKQTEIKDEKGSAVTAKENANPAMAKASEAAGKIVYTGFIAQEVEAAANKLGYPFSGVDKPQGQDGLYGLRYDNFVAPLVKAVQELSKINDDLQKQIDELKAMIVSKGQGTSSAQVVLTDAAALEQNVPNPFDKTTVISYTLPQVFGTAQMLITDQSGKMLKQLNLSGPGKGTITVDAATLAAGIYNYSLLVDGKIIDSRRMVLTR